MTTRREPAVWFPTVRTGTGTDVFTERLISGLNQKGIRAEAFWLPLRSEYAPWTVRRPHPPDWANVAHISSWLHARLLPPELPTVVTVHHAVHRPEARHYKGTVRALYHRLWIAPNERAVLRRANRIVAVSEFVATAARADLVDLPTSVIYNGIDTDRYCPFPRSGRSRFRLLYVGSWIKRKGVDRLRAIMDSLGPGYELEYTGTKRGDTEGNRRDIGYLSSDDEVIDAMRRADLLLFPTRSEGFGLVAVEAMACGLPVVASNIAPLTELVEDQVTGVLCDADDVDAFVDACRQLKEDPTRLDAMRMAARQRAVEHFSSTRMIDAYIELYRGLAGAGACADSP